jgi:hypothetical protein
MVWHVAAHLARAKQCLAMSVCLWGAVSIVAAGHVAPAVAMGATGLVLLCEYLDELGVHLRAPLATLVTLGTAAILGLVATCWTRASEGPITGGEWILWPVAVTAAAAWSLWLVHEHKARLMKALVGYLEAEPEDEPRTLTSPRVRNAGVSRLRASHARLPEGHR